jgi:hypothetical protein
MTLLTYLSNPVLIQIYRPLPAFQASVSLPFLLFKIFFQMPL